MKYHSKILRHIGLPVTGSLGSKQCVPKAVGLPLPAGAQAFLKVSLNSFKNVIVSTFPEVCRW